MKPPPKKGGGMPGTPPGPAANAPVPAKKPPGANPAQLRPPPGAKPAPAPGPKPPAPGLKPPMPSGKPPLPGAKPPAPGAKPPAPASAKPGGQSSGITVGSGQKVTLSTGKPAAKNEYLAQFRHDSKTGRAGAPGAPGTEQIEQVVFSIPNLPSPEAPPLFRDFAEKLLPRLSLPETSLSIMRAFSNIDVTAEKIAICLKRNPYYEDLFYRVIETMVHRQEKPPLEAALILLGMQNSRNFILALQAVRTVTGRHVEMGKDGKLKVAPKDVLKCALRIEEALSGNKDGYADTGYAAGMVFDLLALASEELSQDKNAVSAYIDQTFAHSLKTAQIGAALAKLIPDFGFKKYVFAACLLHDVGKIAMAILEPGYFRFLDDCLKKPCPRAIRTFAERQRFGFDHSVLGSLICAEFGLFGPIQKAILFHHDPFIARPQRPIYDLAAVICMSTNIASNYKKVEKDDDPVLSLWKGPELKDFRLDLRSVRTAVARLSLG